MAVMIGVDPDRPPTAAVLDEHGQLLDQQHLPATLDGDQTLRGWAERWPQRGWRSKAPTASAGRWPSGWSATANRSWTCRPSWPPGCGCCRSAMAAERPRRRRRGRGRGPQCALAAPGYGRGPGHRAPLVDQAAPGPGGRPHPAHQPAPPAAGRPGPRWCPTQPHRQAGRRSAQCSGPDWGAAVTCWQLAGDLIADIGQLA